MDKLSSRKFLLCVGVLVVSAVMLAFKMLPATEFTQIMLGCTSVYTLGNVAQKFSAGSGSSVSSQ